MIAKEQLQAMSDFDVNKELAIVLGRFAGPVGDWMPNGVKVNDESGFFYSEIDYCNNPSDIMPLAFEHGISLIKMLSDWRACTNNGIYVVNSFDDKNPLRAIACCLILVLQEKQK